MLVENGRNGVRFISISVRFWPVTHIRLRMPRPHKRKNPGGPGFDRGAGGGTRTHTLLRAADFESAASTVPPLRRGREV